MILTKPPQESRHFPHKRNQRRFLVCLIVTIFLFVGAVLWILNIEKVIAGPWSSILGVAFTVSGVFIAFLQWYMRPQEVISQNVGDIFGENFGSAGLGPTKRRGVLLVRVKKNLSGTTVCLHRGFDSENASIEVAASVIERDLDGKTCFIAVFPSLEPGKYTASINMLGYKTNITINTKVVTEIDWRYVYGKV